jgi:signal transduction histidine kinase
VAMFVCLLGPFTLCTGQDPVHQRYTVADGLPSNTIFCALQDRDGFMWFGTDAGAVRFDGRMFSTYGVEEGLTDNNIIKLAQDSKGRIWFLTLNGKLCYLLNDSMHNGRTDPELARYESPNGWATFVEDRHGMLWFGGLYDKAIRLDMEGDGDGEWTFAQCKPSVVLDEGGEVVVVLMGAGSLKGHALSLENGGWMVTDSIASQMGQVDVLSGFDGRTPALLLQSGGIHALRKGRWAPFMEATFQKNRQTRCWVDAMGDLWVARNDGGIELWERDRSGFASYRLLFADEIVNFEYVDDERGRWICTSRRGLVHCTEDEFQSAVHKDPAAAEGGGAMLLLQRTRGRGVLVGSAESGIYSFDGRSLFHFPIEGTVGTGRVLDMAEDPEGAIWISSDRRTLVLPPGARTFQDVAVRHREVPHLVSPMVGSKAVEILPDGSVWTANFGFWGMTKEGGRSIRVPLPDSLSFAGRSLAPHIDAKGRIWYETNEQLHCIANGRKQRFPQLEGRTGLRITDIKSLPSGELLIGTTGAGVLVLDSMARAIGGFTMADGLISNDIVRIRTFQDTLLIATKQGLHVVIGPLVGPSAQRSLLTVKGFGAGEVNDAITDGDRLLLATSNGVCSVPFPRKAIAMAPPRIAVAGLWLNGQEVNRSQRLELAQGRDPVRIAFRVIAFADADRVEYQYRLRSDNRWSRTNDGILELASLSPGSYAIAMRARRPGSGWSGPAQVHLVVNAPWWMKGSTWILGSVLISLLMVQLTRYLLRRKYRLALAQLRQRELVNKERGRIAADIHDDLGADLSRLLHYARRAEPSTERPLTEGLDKAIDKMDEIIWALDPKRDTLQSTVQFIEQQAREAAEEHGLKFRADVQVPRTPVHLAAGHRRELMLLAREAIRNILDHAEASTLWIEWRAMNDAVQLVIRDDGRGFEPIVGSSSRYGLGNMQERAERLGGTLRIERQEPRGTRVLVLFPLFGITHLDDAANEGDDHLAP